MYINYVLIISNCKSLHKSLFIEARRPRLFANHVFPRCAMRPLPARHTCRGASESQAVFLDNHCKLLELSQPHHPTRTSLAPHQSCFLSVTYRGSNKDFPSASSGNWPSLSIYVDLCRSVGSIPPLWQRSRQHAPVLPTMFHWPGEGLLVLVLPHTCDHRVRMASMLWQWFHRCGWSTEGSQASAETVSWWRQGRNQTQSN